jgi:hypothetical protein
VAALSEDIRDEAPDGVAAQLDRARQLDGEGRSAEALEHLRQVSATGDLRARAALAFHLLTRPPGNMAEGTQIAVAAAEAGSPDACYLVAMLNAGGVGQPQSWRVALDYVQRAAELGHAAARAELAFLAGASDIAAALASGEAIAPGSWERLRKSFDVRSWLFPVPAKPAAPLPRIAIAEGFIAPAVCGWLIENSRAYLEPAKIDHPGTGTAVYAETRTNSAAQFQLAEANLVMHLVRARIAALTGVPSMALEGSAVLHYEVGQQFSPHYDFLNTAEPGYARQVAEFGQRILTCLIYLNEDFEGGETDFPSVPWRYKGKTGDAMFFWNVQPNGQPDRRMLHAGMPPTRGEKWLFSQWVRGRLS